MGGHERLDDRQHGAGLGLVAFEGVDHQREPTCVGQQPDRDLRLQPALFAEPGLAKTVALISLEVQRGHVIQHQGGRPEPGVGSARRGDPGSPLIGGVAGESTLDRAVGRRRHAGLLQHPDRVQLAGGLDDPGQHQPLENLVTATRGVQLQHLPGRGEHIPQVLGTGSQDRQLRRAGPAITKVEAVLVDVQPLRRDRP